MIAAAAVVVILTGYAYDRHDGTPLYLERHVQEFRGDALVSDRTDYVAPDGQLIATRSSTYEGNPFAPTYRFTDRRDGYVEGTESGPGELRMYRDTGDGEQSKRVATDARLVADSGFDRFIKAHLPALARGEAQHCRLALAGRLTTLKFRISPIAGAAAGELELIAEPDSLLSFFVPAIRLTYDRATGRLIRYVGVSNIRNPSGELHDTRIEFPPAGAGTPAGFAATP